MKEIWKDIKGYEGLYKISNCGRVKSLYKDWGFKDLSITKGYYTVHLYKNGGRKNKPIHRLVSQHFIPNPKNKPQVNHIDGNKLNNYYKNLEWVTIKENHAHAKENNLLVNGEDVEQSKLTNQEVLEIKNKIINGVSYNKLADEYNVTPSNICYIARGKSWADYGPKMNGSKRLSPNDVKKIRSIYKTGNKTQKEIANNFDISQSHVSRIIRKDSWLYI